MRLRLAIVFGALSAAAAVHAQGTSMVLPKQMEAGSAISVQTTGNGKAVLYIVGLGQVLRQDVQLGEAVSIAPGVLDNAGHYLAVLVGGSSTDNGAFDVLPAKQVGRVSFLAKPSRLPVGLHNGISGAVYVFDAYRNLITTPMSVSFQLSGATGPTQTRTVMTRNGWAWTQMDSATKEGSAQFEARVGGVSSTRVIEEVPGDPCGLRISARAAGRQIALQTDPVRDCGGNAVPDGTVVTFTEAYNGEQSTVDVPLKRGVAQTELPAHDGAKISAATGVVMGNEIHWGKP